MAMYKDLNTYREADPAKADFIAGKLLQLRALLDEQITSERGAGTLIIGTWNIREFDSGKGGARLDESYHYIAEIIDRFDICAVQEVRSDLAPLKRLVRLLGPNWDWFVTDVSAGRGGNDERTAFLYNRSKVLFRNLIGEIVLSRARLIEGEQFARTPFFAAFQAHWFRFILCTCHMYFGAASGEKKARRVAEIAAISEELSRRAAREGDVYVLLGDLNIVDDDDPTMAALTDGTGMDAPDFGPTNLGGTKHYDKIAFTGEGKKHHCLRHGVIDWRAVLFLDEERDHYEALANNDPARPGQKRWVWSRYYNTWRTHQMSDHLPIWVELKVDFSDAYLERYLMDQKT